MRRSAWVTDANAALLTDLYQFTMLQSYLEHGLDAEAVFELTVRRLPAGRNYLLACGLDDVLRYLETLRFTPEALDYLASLDRFSSDFIAYLRDFRFEGDVYAIAEGTPTFAHEPLLEVVAPLPQAQLVETFLLNQVHLQTLAASKAARVVEAAAGRTVVDFRPASRAWHGRRFEASTGLFRGGRSGHLERAGGTGVRDSGGRDDGAQLRASTSKRAGCLPAFHGQLPSHHIAGRHVRHAEGACGRSWS